MTRRLPATLAALALLLAACGGGDDESTDADESSSTTTAAGDDTTTIDGDDSDTDESDAGDDDDTDEDAGDDEEAGGGDIPFGNCSSAQAPDLTSTYVVSGIPADDPDGGLVARVLPGGGEEARDVLVEGTEITPGAVQPENDCVVLGDGSVWWFVNTPQLATGGFVNSRYLAPGEAGGGGTALGEDDFDVELALVACVYEGNGEACDLLTTFGYGDASDNYGLGNSLSQAPAEFLAQDCLNAFDALACAELGARGPGGDVEALAAQWVAAFQADDQATLDSLAGPQVADLTDGPAGDFPDTPTGVESLSVVGNEFSWVWQPTLPARCIVADGLVQACRIDGD